MLRRGEEIACLQDVWVGTGYICSLPGTLATGHPPTHAPYSSNPGLDPPPPNATPRSSHWGWHTNLGTLLSTLPCCNAGHSSQGAKGLGKSKQARCVKGHQEEASRGASSAATRAWKGACRCRSKHQRLRP